MRSILDVWYGEGFTDVLYKRVAKGDVRESGRGRCLWTLQDKQTSLPWNRLIKAVDLSAKISAQCPENPMMPERRGRTALCLFPPLIPMIEPVKAANKGGLARWYSQKVRILVLFYDRGETNLLARTS